jgi:hypothetical protein
LQQVTGSFAPERALRTVEGRFALPEADLSLAEAIYDSVEPIIVREHLLSNANTLAFLAQSRVWPVILWRALDDSMVSLAEEWARQWSQSDDQVARDGYHLQFLGDVPQIFIENFRRADWTRRYDMAIDLALPWYSRFIAGWDAVRAQDPGFGTFLTYEDVVNDGVAAAMTRGALGDQCRERLRLVARRATASTMSSIVGECCTTPAICGSPWKRRLLSSRPPCFGALS